MRKCPAKSTEQLINGFMVSSVSSSAGVPSVDWKISLLTDFCSLHVHDDTSQLVALLGDFSVMR